MPKFCPTCGNSSDVIEFLGNFCINCAREKFKSTLPKSVEISLCKKCGKIKAGKSIVYEPINGRSIEMAIRQHFHRYKCHLISYTDKTALVDISDETENGIISAEHELELEFKKTNCDICYKKSCNYHEAVIQLRGNQHKIEKFIERITRYFEINNGFVTKIEEDPNGINLYLSSKSLAGAFISRLKLHPNTSYTLSGVKNGKRVYKNTYAIRY